MKKHLIFISMVLIFTILTTPILTLQANTNDESWKVYLADFLKNNYPSLFDEEIKKKNEEIINKYYKIVNYQEDGWSALSFGSDSFSKDVIVSVELFIPGICEFFDLDFDGIPEVIINYGGMASGMGGREVFKLYDMTYESIGGLDGGEYRESLYLNPQNKIVSIKSDWTQVIEIIDKKLVYSEYIDSLGNDTYDGIKYNRIGNYSEYFYFDSYEDWLNCEVFLADLRRFPEFDCSDVLASITSISIPTSPQTNDMNILLFIILELMSVVLFYTFKKNNNSIEK